ncbi:MULTISPECIES: bactofilin family protein [Sphingomonas]|jgi:cytoskeletal protein CcmA (bactofilin family)|uniref:Cytoskeletal protein CcmA (Bactofilin family) n=1 Tax=Sphingomonas kyeonggiensis TaxID=1268553 RepID=A0A7W7NT74_9SPHN|nr:MULTISPECIES: polymer-forming cytoskeletal protein [Sphingomonas]MBB4840995.1 cytoskeletal protein CcmA (bactofilin family) [Sphingomonas kyeonggiensis]WHU02791.1 polymer-forming cytoskeletal protein [Sphingomonas sp. NIBR02145]
MFNSNNRGRDRDERPAMPPAPPQQSSGNGKRGMFSVIGPDVTVTGNVSATADLHIDGRIEGDVHCGSLAQGAESQIFGNVTAETARLAGAIEGTVRVRQLTIERSAKITGDVEYENITIENGGHIDGRLKHMSTVQAAAPAAPAGPRPVEAAPSPFAAAANE